MAKATRHIDRLAQGARPPCAVRVAAHAADFVAPHAERFATTRVAARALERIAPRGAAVIVGLTAQTDPARRVRALRAVRDRDAATLMASIAGRDRVARGAEAALGARFGAVTTEEAGAVHAVARRVEEAHSLGEDRDGLAVATRTEGVGVARRAEVGRSARARAVIAEEVAAVGEVIRRRLVLSAEVLMANVALALGDLILMRMAREAERHRRAHVGRVFGHALVAARAVAFDARDVLVVPEAQARARDRRLLDRVRETVAACARALVVRLLMALQTRRVARDVHGIVLAGRSDARVAIIAAHALGDVRVVLEGPPRRRTNAENAGAGGGSQRERQEGGQGETRAHRPPHALEALKSALSARTF